MKRAYLFVVCFGLVQLLVPTLGQRNEPTGGAKTVLLIDQLSKFGNLYDCYFTLETGLVSGDVSNSLENQKVPSTLNSRNLADALEQIQKFTPNLAYTFNRVNPRIVYVFDPRLMKKKEYALEQSIDDIRFDGTALELIQELSRRGIPITSHGPQASTELGTESITGTFHIREGRIQIRDLLTNSIPLRNRGRILWLARTELDSDQKTFLRYRR